MKLSDLLTPRGRRATGKLSLDLLNITGKVVIAGAVGLKGALVRAAASTNGSHEDKDIDSCADLKDGYRNGYEGYGYYMGGYRVDED